MWMSPHRSVKRNEILCGPPAVCDCHIFIQEMQGAPRTFIMGMGQNVWLAEVCMVEMPTELPKYDLPM